ncbi:outer membrane lipoprotein-sorting protein [Spirochaetia bacterium 38H-sp]|uniref:Outer membrane lipoprotein-sorting protein n=1 Tax=Rarispira pelagica TaxID=3141764 RepID=A0ABU9U939_9SPIR
MNRFLSVFILFFMFCSVFVFAEDLSDANSILRSMELSLNPKVYHAVFKMESHYPDRPDPAVMVFESWYKEGVGSFIVVLEPARSKGMRFLQKEGSLWMYNPRAGSKRPVRLSARASFQGSLFSNHDVSDPQYTDDYDAKIMSVERVEHPELGIVDMYILEAVAKRSDVAYGRVVIYVVKDSLIPFKIKYYSRSDFLIKEMILSGVKDIAGALRPTIYRMDSFEQEGAYSVVEVSSMEALKELGDEMFSRSALTR